MRNPFTSENLIGGFFITFLIALGILFASFCYAMVGLSGVLIILAFIASVIGITMYLDWKDER